MYVCTLTFVQKHLFCHPPPPSGWCNEIAKKVIPGRCICDACFICKRKISVMKNIPLSRDRIIFKCNQKYILYWKTLPEKCPFSELFWSVFSRIWKDRWKEMLSKYSILAKRYKCSHKINLLIESNNIVKHCRALRIFKDKQIVTVFSNVILISRHFLKV